MRARFPREHAVNPQPLIPDAALTGKLRVRSGEVLLSDWATFLDYKDLRMRLLFCLQS